MKLLLLDAAATNSGKLNAGCTLLGKVSLAYWQACQDAFYVSQAFLYGLLEALEAVVVLHCAHKLVRVWQCRQEYITLQSGFCPGLPLATIADIAKHARKQLCAYMEVALGWQSRVSGSGNSALQLLQITRLVLTAHPAICLCRSQLLQLCKQLNLSMCSSRHRL